MRALQFFGDHIAPSHVITYHIESSPTALFAYKPENNVESNTFVSGLRACPIAQEGADTQQLVYAVSCHDMSQNLP